MKKSKSRMIFLFIIGLILTVATLEVNIKYYKRKLVQRKSKKDKVSGPEEHEGLVIDEELSNSEDNPPAEDRWVNLPLGGDIDDK